MNNVLGSNTKAKVIFAIISIGLILTTWYKLKVRGITTTADSEVKYQTVLICENTSENHVHTDECYDVIEVKSLEETPNVAIDEEKAMSNSENETDEDQEMLESSGTNSLDESEVINGNTNAENQKSVSEEIEKEAVEVVEDEQKEVEDEKVEQVKDGQKNVEKVEETLPKDNTTISPKELKYEDDDLIVTVTEAESGAIPDDAKIVVKPILREDDEEKYAEIEENLSSKMEEKDEYMLGFLAYDITLNDENGNKIEPVSKVNVSIEYRQATSPIGSNENDELDIAVHHFIESDEGEITVVDLDESNQLKEIEINENQEIEKITFETESFSSYTITWKVNYTTYAEITVKYIDSKGNEIQGPDVGAVTIGNSTSTYKSLVEHANSTITADGKTYTFRGAHLGSYDGDEVKYVRFTQSSSKRYVTFYNSEPPFNNYTSYVRKDTYSNSKLTYNVYLVYDEQGSEPQVDKTQQIIFWHREQDNDDFASKSPPNEYYRPYSEYGYSKNELTNIVQFVVVLADEDGKVILNGSNPSVNLPEGSIVPDGYIFDVGTNGTLQITESTFAGISIPGYSYAGSYAYFGWTGNYDMKTMINVEEFKNLGAKSTKYKNYGESFYSVIGYSGYGYLADGTERERPGYSDYSYAEFGTEGYNYWAYQSTGVLMIVLQPVSEEIAYKTYYHNDYNPGGSANLNIIDTTTARMIKGDWDATNYKYNYHGETIMTTTTNLIPPSDDYVFDGWYDDVDSEGNGTGNKIIGSSQEEDGTVYYFAVTESDNRKVEILANNNMYARWIPKSGNFTITKAISGALNATEVDELKGKLQFNVKNSSDEVVQTISASAFNWSGNTGTYKLQNLSTTDFYTVEEINADMQGHVLFSSIAYPNNATKIKPSSTEELSVLINNNYRTNIKIRKVDQDGNSTGMKDIGFTLAEGDNSAVAITNEDGFAEFTNIECGNTYILTESQPLNAYYGLEKSIQIFVSENGEIIIENFEELGELVTINDNNEIQVVNMKHIVLPKTGGNGVYVNYIIGLGVMLTAVKVFYCQKNFKKQKK
ncbi:MAG: hypothetical protein IKD77_00905 [Bacilli bacterium]|nr:hypothetical protein [Bacilli bacterium]